MSLHRKTPSDWVTHVPPSQLFERETVLVVKCSISDVGLSKDVLLMVGKAFRRLQGKEMRKGKDAKARRALTERYNTAR